MNDYDKKLKVQILQEILEETKNIHPENVRDSIEFKMIELQNEINYK